MAAEPKLFELVGISLFIVIILAVHQPAGFKTRAVTGLGTSGQHRKVTRWWRNPAIWSVRCAPLQAPYLLPAIVRIPNKTVPACMKRRQTRKKSGLCAVSGQSHSKITGSSCPETLNSVSAILGGQAAGNGSVTISGSRSSWQITSGNFDVGSFGTGQIEIVDGGLLQTTFSPVTRIGQQAAGSGSVTVTGAGSLLELQANFWLGSTGSGQITISDVGQVLYSGNSTLGQAGNSTGELSRPSSMKARPRQWTRSYPNGLDLLRPPVSDGVKRMEACICLRPHFITH